MQPTDHPSGLTIWRSEGLLFYIAAFLLIATVAVGVTLLVAHATGRRVRRFPALFHGGLAALGFLALCAATYRSVSGSLFGPLPAVLLVITLVVACAGTVLFASHARFGRIPLGIAALHGAGAMLVVSVLVMMLADWAQKVRAAPPRDTTTALAAPSGP